MQSGCYLFRLKYELFSSGSGGVWTLEVQERHPPDQRGWVFGCRAPGGTEFFFGSDAAFFI